MEVRRFKAKVLADGHLSLPKGITRNVGVNYDVVLAPANGKRDKGGLIEFCDWVAKKRKVPYYTEEAIAKIAHKRRGIPD